MVRSLDRIAQDELLAEQQVTDLNMDATGQGSFDVASVNPINPCLLYTSPSPRDGLLSRMPSSA